MTFAATGDRTPASAAPLPSPPPERVRRGTPLPSSSALADTGLHPKAVPGAPRVSELPTDVIESIERIEGLAVVLVWSIGQMRCLARWHRPNAPISIPSLTGFGTRWLIAHRQSFRAAPRGTVEMEEGTLLLESVNEARLVGFFFSAAVPQGLLRLRARQLSERMSRISIPAETEHSATIASPAVVA